MIKPYIIFDQNNLSKKIKSFLSKNKRQTRNIDLITGNLCLFPSSLLHHTVPFESEDDRIVLAFDVVPKS